MPVEQPTYISDLVPEWPLGVDGKSAGDDHIRLIKAVLQNTFPELDGAVTATVGEINSLANGLIYIPINPEDGNPSRWAAYSPDDSSTWIPFQHGKATVEQMQVNENLSVNFAMMRDIFFPVGHVIINNGNNPANYLGFGTWQQQSGFLAGVGTAVDGVGKSETINLGQNHAGGSWRVRNDHLVYQNLQLQNGWAIENGNHMHGIQGGHADGVGATGSWQAKDGTGVLVESEYAGQHPHDVTGNVVIGTGDNINGASHFPPYFGLYIWERTA